jgi:alkylated DNA repair dioxygenase AlkB
MNESVAVKGLYYIAAYVTPNEEQELLSIVDQQSWLIDFKRRVQHYGYRYDYRLRRTHKDLFLGSLPIWAQNLANRLHRDQWTSYVPDQLIVNEYEPGQGIANHIDCEPCFGDTILAISLGSPCVMRWTHATTGERVETLLDTCSLVVMQGEARHMWKHGIPARKRDQHAGQIWTRGRRVSLTFRNVVLG